MFNVVSNNRLDRTLARHAGYLVQTAPLLVDEINGSISVLAKRLSGSLIAACQFARYCPSEMSDLRHTINHNLGFALDQDFIFNFLNEAPQAHLVGSLPADAKTLHGLRGDTSFEWTENRVIRPDVRLFTDVVVGSTLRLTLRFNTAVVESALARAVALAFESAVVQLAIADIGTTWIAEELEGVGAVTTIDRVNVHGALASISQSRAAMTDALGSEGFGLFVDGERLLAHVTDRTSRDGIQDIHRRVMRTLPNYPQSIAPRHYILHAASPIDTDNRSAWEALEIVDSGGGRTASPETQDSCEECS